jgi:tetratricopeptide (TPR) repeat protein
MILDQHRCEEAFRLYHSGIAHVESKEYTIAIQELKASIAIKSDFGPSYKYLGLAQLGSSDYFDSSVNLLTALRLSPVYEDGGLRYYLGNAYLGSGDIDAAKRQWRETLHLRGSPAAMLAAKQLAKHGG